MSTMYLRRSFRVVLTALTLVVGLSCLPALAGAEQVRTKDGARERPRAGSRETPRPEVLEGAAVSLTADRKLVRQGDTVRLTVRIAAAENVGHVPFHLSYDPAVLRFVKAQEGEFLRADGNGTVFLAAPASTGSALVVGLSRLGRQVGVAGSGDLCTFEFEAVGRGDAKLAFARASVRDPENRALPAQFQPVTLSVR